MLLFVGIFCINFLEEEEEAIFAFLVSILRITF